jgi:ribosome-binding protein aMBF1 (putative translation factor)
MARKRVKLPKADLKRALKAIIAEGAAKRQAKEEAAQAAKQAACHALHDKFIRKLHKLDLSDQMTKIAWHRFDSGDDPDEIIDWLKQNKNPSHQVKCSESKPRYKFGASKADTRMATVHVVKPPEADKRTITAVTAEESESSTDDVEQEPGADTSDWGAIIRERIAAQGWSAYALGIQSGVDPSILLRFMAGQRDIRLETARKICTALELGLMPIDANERAD